MWLKILETNWKTRYEDDETRSNTEPTSSEECNAQPRMMESKDKIRLFLAWFREYYVYPIFGAAVLAILIIGERNLFSTQVRYQTEPVVNIGQ